MSEYVVTDTELESVADAIRTKGGTQADLEFPSGFVTAIDDISGGGSTLVSKTITQNGVYDPADDNADGYDEVTVNVAGSADIDDNLLCNWDFSDPVNSRGGSSYSSSNMIYSIDGWQLQGGSLAFDSDGIKLSRYSAGTAGYFMQRFKTTPTSAFNGKTVTMTAKINGKTASETITLTSGQGAKGNGFGIDNTFVRIYNYGTEFAVTIDIGADTGDDVINAIKLEGGSQSTAIGHANKTSEEIKVAMGMVYNS